MLSTLGYRLVTLILLVSVVATSPAIGQSRAKKRPKKKAVAAAVTKSPGQVASRVRRPKKKPKTTALVAAVPCKANCRLITTKSLTLGGPTDEYLSGRPAAVTRDRAGRIFVLVRGKNGGTVGVYDKSGVYTRDLAYIGDGPGQVRFPHWVDISFDDTLRVYHGDRVTVFDRNLNPVRQIAAANSPRFQTAVAMLSPKKFVVLASLPPPEPAPVFVRDLSSATALKLQLLPAGTIPHAVARAGGEKFWIASAAWHGGTGYQLSLTDTKGSRYTTINRQPSWWVARDSTAISPNDARFWGSTVAAVRSIRGKVYVLVRTPKPSWLLGGDAKGSSKGYQTVLEVVDPQTKAVISSNPVEGIAIGMVDDDHFAAYRQTTNGIPLVDIYDVAVKGKLVRQTVPKRPIRRFVKRTQSGRDSAARSK